MSDVDLILGDITKVATEVIVNAANRDLRPGGGVDGAIRAAGGLSITEQTSTIGPIETGQVVATAAGDLPAQYVIHTAGPIWGSVAEDEADRLLAACYVNSLDLATELRGNSIAFPNISTGIYRYPPDRAARVATSTVASWIEANPGKIMQVSFVCFDEPNYALYRGLLGL